MRQGSGGRGRLPRRIHRQNHCCYRFRRIWPSVLLEERQRPNIQCGHQSQECFWDGATLRRHIWSHSSGATNSVCADRWDAILSRSRTRLRTRFGFPFRQIGFRGNVFGSACVGLSNAVGAKLGTFRLLAVRIRGLTPLGAPGAYLGRTVKLVLAPFIAGTCYAAQTELRPPAEDASRRTTTSRIR